MKLNSVSTKFYSVRTSFYVHTYEKYFCTYDLRLFSVKKTKNLPEHRKVICNCIRVLEFQIAIHFSYCFCSGSKFLFFCICQGNFHDFLNTISTDNRWNT